MNELTLRRFGSIPGQGTYGRIYFGDGYANTVECRWQFNEPFKSCVPLGRYELIPFYSNAHKINTLALRCPENGVYPTFEEMKDSGGTRYACIIHPANIPSQVVGCIGLGNKFRWFNGINNYHPQMGVSSSSREQVDKFLLFCIDKVTHLNIVQEPCG